jgi:hypothetical protein
LPFLDAQAGLPAVVIPAEVSRVERGPGSTIRSGPALFADLCLDYLGFA